MSEDDSTARTSGGQAEAACAPPAPGDHGLRGGLALADRDHLDPDARTTMVRLEDPRARPAGFGAAGDGRLTDPFDARLLNPATGDAFLAWQRAEERSSSLSARARQVVILSVGAVWRSARELAAHAAPARAVGLTDHEVRELSAGSLPASLAADEVIAGRAALTITLERSLGAGAYDETVAALGERGLFDLLSLVGACHFVCALSNAFAGPARPARPLDRSLAEVSAHATRGRRSGRDVSPEVIG